MCKDSLCIVIDMDIYSLTILRLEAAVCENRCKATNQSLGLMHHNQGLVRNKILVCGKSLCESA